jgi:hypothetical protein
MWCNWRRLPIWLLLLLLLLPLLYPAVLIEFSGECSRSNCARLLEQLQGQGVDHVIGFGGVFRVAAPTSCRTYQQYGTRHSKKNLLYGACGLL